MDEEIAAKDDEIGVANSHEATREVHCKDNEKITALEANFEHPKPIVCTVDLRTEETEHANKCPRVEIIAKSNLTIPHEQNQKVTQA